MRCINGYGAVAAMLAVVLGGTAPALGQAAGASPDAAADPPAANYWVYVGAESADLIHRVRFGPDGAVVEKTTPVGAYALEVEGPHGLVISPDGRRLHMTTGHGLPDGMFWTFELGPDTPVAEPIALGRFPATVDVTPDGLYAFVVNFNLHGEHVPSSVSVVYTPDHTEVARVETCTMPHGSRIGPQGLRHYSACMMDDEVVEIDTRTFDVARRFGVARGNEGPLPAPVAGKAAGAAVHEAHAGHDGHAGGVSGAAGRRTMPEPSCSPTWAQPAPDGRHVYVACNRSDEILEIATESWSLARRFAAGRGPYNLAVTPDGRTLVATLKQGGAVQLFDLVSGRSRATIPSSTTVTHGVVISPDSRYAFVSVEGVGAEPGKVDVIDLAADRLAASAEVGLQASGIAFWKMEPAPAR